VTVEVDGAAAISETDPRYLSVALDTASVLGGAFWSKGGGASSIAGDREAPPLDLAAPAFLERARALAPAYLRIGGTAADTVDYQLQGEAPLPKGDKLKLTKERWGQIADFSRALGFPLLFTLNAGPATRDAKGAWTSGNASTLVAEAARDPQGDPVAAWELGNEINAYPLMHGLTRGVSGEQLAADTRAARSFLDGAGSQARLAAPASAFWPVLGEIHGVMEDALRHGGSHLQIVTWHYYPQQSRRCPAAVRRAGPEVLLDPGHLDEFARWAKVVRTARDAFAPRAELWLGETGNAQCGGEPGVSDAFAGSLWWIDELGLAARTGHRVVVRQSLVGSDYGLLDPETLEPRPDYWASLLWKRAMGTRVLRAEAHGSAQVRAYAHCAASGPAGSTALAVVNLDGDAPAEVIVPWPLAGAAASVVTAPSLDSRAISINGEAPEKLTWAPVDGALRLPPRSYALAVFPAAGAPACAGP
jgi:heparanase 1